MKRRNFGLLAGTSLVTVSTLRAARAQSATPDPSLLTTTLTPMGSERAGNADGSIPAWTGGVTSPPLPANTPIDVAMFADEAPLYTVDSSNIAQYQNLLTAGTQELMSKYGFSLKVYQCHRTAACPKYVYDNIAQNAVRAKLDPAGGEYGFTGGYGGIPFPIIDTANPLNGGAQLIWNHLLAWPGSYQNWTTFSPSLVVSNGTMVLSEGGKSRFEYPYYDPNGSLETYKGYFYKLHESIVAPANVNGQEDLVWQSSNTLLNPDITWTVLNGQGRVRKAPNETYDTPSPNINDIGNSDEGSAFQGSPDEYNWTYIDKREMLIPYNNNGLHFHTAQEIMGPRFPNPDLVRWEKHRVWIVEANLRPGKRNVLQRRRFYLDEDTWQAILGESYDANGAMVKCYTVYNRCVPSMPGTVEQGMVLFNLMTGQYAYVGSINYPPYTGDEYVAPIGNSVFDPQAMAATAAF
jgi:hypothetical protein